MLKREGVVTFPLSLYYIVYFYKGMQNMDTIKSVDKAIESMKADIVLTNTLFSDNPPDNINNWLYYISIYANDEHALHNASKLLRSLSVLTRSVTIIPRTYKACKFDCFTVCNIFNNIHSISSYNIDTVSIIEQTDLNDGDFYMSVVRENKATELMDIFTYRDLRYYYELL